MGMQCTFNEVEIDENIIDGKIDLHEDGTKTCTLWEKQFPTYTYQFNYVEQGNEAQQEPNNFCWFDVGHTTDDQIQKLKFLIRNRICFVCA